MIKNSITPKDKKKVKTGTTCYLCGSAIAIEILNKDAVAVWTNTSDDVVENKVKYKCVIKQCQDCGHVYQPVDNCLKSILNKIYLSKHAQVSTPPGKGNWGKERARDFLESTDFKNYRSAVEIGCGDGYILRCLKNKGFTDLVGIEPSIDKTHKIEGIKYLKAFVDPETKLSHRYDFIFANGVFEHIENINGIIKFCRNNLKDKGMLFFSVPNSERQLNDGDPALFLHQHLHYYTRASLGYLLAKNGFIIDSIVTNKDAFRVYAKISAERVRTPEVVYYETYKIKLEKVLNKLKEFIHRKNIIIHGVANSLNNILGWLKENPEFTLVDNDSNKHGKIFFEKKVNSMSTLNLNNYEGILIVPTAFYEIIRKAYVLNGFKGEYESVML